MTRPGELDHPEAVYQRDPAPNRADPSYSRVIGIVAGIGLAAVLALHFALRFLQGPK